MRPLHSIDFTYKIYQYVSIFEYPYRAAYESFKTGSDPSSIAAAANGDTTGHAAFYSNLYIGLWYEAEGDAEKAKMAMLKAVGTDYARGSGDYMAALARVHVAEREWSV